MSQECKNQFDEIKKGKKHRYVVFYIEDEKMIKVECVGDRDASYDSFLNDIMKGGEGECRYGLYDFEYEHQCQGTTGNQQTAEFINKQLTVNFDFALCRSIEKTKVVPDVLVPGYCQDQEENVVLL